MDRKLIEVKISNSNGIIKIKMGILYIDFWVVLTLFIMFTNANFILE